MVAAKHSGKLSLGHMAGDTLTPFAGGLMVGMISDILTRSSWQGRQEFLGMSLWRKRPLDVWQCKQSSCPDLTHGLIIHDVYV